MSEPVQDEIDVGQLGPLRQIGTGGQAAVFELSDDPDTLVYKEYSPGAAVSVPVLRSFVAFISGLDEPVRERVKARAAWPLTVVRRDGVVSGFLMPHTPRGFTVALEGLVSDSVPAKARYLTDKQYLRDRGRWIDSRFRLEFLRDTVETLSLLHQLGIAVGGDWSNHLLFSQRVRPRCFFVGCDAMRLGEATVLESAAVPDWRVDDAGGEEELATPAGDCYQLGLLAVRIFSGDSAARDPARATGLPARVRELAARSLRSDPAQRPAVQDWLSPLDLSLREVSAREPEPVVQRSGRGKPAWLAGLSAIVGLITLIIRLSHFGSSPTTTVYLPPLPVPDYSLGFPWPTPELSAPVLPSVTLCGNVPHSMAADPKNTQEQAVLPALDNFLCGLNSSDYVMAAGPSDARSQANFDALASSANGALLNLKVSGARALNATTLSADTSISSGTKCWTMTFVFDQDLSGDYALSSIGPPEAARCG